MSLNSSLSTHLTPLISLNSSHSPHLAQLISFTFVPTSTFSFSDILLFSFSFSVLNLCLIKLLTCGVIRSYNCLLLFIHCLFLIIIIVIIIVFLKKLFVLTVLLVLFLVWGIRTSRCRSTAAPAQPVLDGLTQRPSSTWDGARIWTTKETSSTRLDILWVPRSSND